MSDRFFAPEDSARRSWHIHWACGVLQALGASEDEAWSDALLVSAELSVAIVQQVDTWKSELREAGL